MHSSIVLPVSHNHFCSFSPTCVRLSKRRLSYFSSQSM
ncbi:hypothetical protein PHET_10433 [Paragonimus heterotremus]|uniref:Uncharacterized protein n=1 Tax=Paragonimus heterotremus TaxID=100268 RepID=A0A8J4SK32_9TREM|nr:hypothetical protein PHET_10433 [Paragonimus heterotremus]